MKIYRNILLLCMLGLFTNVFAQSDTIQKRIEVVRAYEPIVNDAFKINYLPIINDTVKKTVRYNYELLPHHLSTLFSVKPIKAAKMVGEPLDELYNSFIRFGMGNFYTPLVEANYHNLRSKYGSYGFDGRFLGSYGKIKLDDGTKESIGYNDSYLRAFGKRIWRDYVIGGSVKYSLASANNYGYDAKKDVFLAVSRDDYEMSQRMNVIGGKMYVKSTHVDSTHLNYKADIGYDYVSDKHSFNQSKLDVNTAFDHFWNKERVGADIGIKVLIPNNELDSGVTTKFKLRPWLSTYGNRWKVKAGVSIVYINTPREDKMYLYPFGNLQYNIAGDLIVPYIDVNGGTDVHDYESLVRENIYLTPGITAEPTNNKLTMKGGLKGNLSPVVSYNFSAAYSLIDNMYFFINDYEKSPFGNSFKLIYDDVELFTMSGHIGINPSERLRFNLKGNYYNYKMGVQEHAWHKPDWDITLNTQYNIQDKMIFALDIYGFSSRYAMGRDTRSVLLEGNLDVNFTAEYRYTPVLSFFTRLHNIAFQKYETWNQYPVEKFGFMLGLTYKL